MEVNNEAESRDALVEAYIGPYNKSYYLRAFEKIGTGAQSTWHWPALFATSGWLLYRKMWLYALLYIIALPIVHLLLTALVSATLGGTIGNWFWIATYVAIAFVLAPLLANNFYHRHVTRKVAALGQSGATHEQQLALAADKGGTSVWALVGVAFGGVPLVGILAAIVLPAYQDYTTRAQISEGLALAGGAKAAVFETYQRTGHLPADNASAGLPPLTDISGKYVAAVEVFEGKVYIYYGNESHIVIEDSALVLSPSVDTGGTMHWSCGSDEIANKHLPSACRR